jgi:hypothetical protein
MNEFLAYLDAHPWAMWTVGTAVAGLFSLLMSKRSQIDAWAESNPRVAGVMKLLRGLGVDPWLIAQGLMLIVAKRLPATKPTGRLPPLTVIALALVCLGVSGCAAFPGSQASECSETSLGLIVAECKLRIERDCPRDQDIEQCQAVKDCDAAVDKWAACGGAK